MSAPPSTGLRDRLARVRSASPPTEDLDWFLFQSFPECEVPPATLSELVPDYEKALRSGAKFDYELLFVRVLELHELVGVPGVHSVARAALDRARAGGFEPADAIAALRFALRALPADDPFLDDVLTGAHLASLRFHWTLDFILDERDPGEYLALSYLRDEDPATAAVLERFRVPAARLEKLHEFFEVGACRERLAAGWSAEVPAEEDPALSASVAERIPGFRPGR